MNITHLMTQPLHFLKESVLPALTNQQKKILVIALTALGCLAACLYYFLRVKPEALKIIDQPLENKEEILDEAEEVLELSEAHKKPQEKLSAKSLLVLTSQPVTYNPFEFGGDDTLEPIATPEIIAQNAAARMKIVDAIGGNEACKLIPIVECPSLSAYLDCFDNYQQFPKGHAILQGEDQAGRKFVLLRLLDKLTYNPAKKIVIERIFQRRRETCISPMHRGQDGSAWYSHINNYAGVNKIADAIKDILAYSHPKYILLPQE